MPKIGYGSVSVREGGKVIGQGVYTLEEAARYTRLAHLEGLAGHR
jgi:hypothetical protein